MRPFIKTIIVTALYLAAGVLAQANAKTFYIDPVNGSMSGSGSAAAPWRTLQEVIETAKVESRSWIRPYTSGGGLEPHNQGAPVQSGDTLILMSGHHGKVNIHKYINEQVITIKAETGQTPTLSQLHFQSSSNWVVSGLTISPIYGETDQSTIIRVESHSFNGPSSAITIHNNTLFSAPDIKNWSAADWLSKAKSGIAIDGKGSTVTNNTIRNIGFGITVSADNVNVINNSVINFSGDAVRGLGNYGLFEANLIANAFKVNGNHDDGFQSWSRDGKPVIGVVLRRNKFFTNYNHPNPSLLSTFQGIGCFDGYYNNWVIENNLLAVSHWHGISVYGANNTRIVNNTVVDDSRHNDDPMVPWIRLTTHKNGSHGTGNLVRNNIGRLASTDKGTTIDFNLDPQVDADDHTNYDAYFVSRLAFNYQLKRSSAAVGTGSTDMAPGTDIDGRDRTGSIDIGAYQSAALSMPFLFLLMDE